MNFAQTENAQNLQVASEGKPVFQINTPVNLPQKPETKQNKTGRGRKPSEGPTKQSKAVEIFDRLKGEKEAVISAIKEELAMSEAGATTYFYNAKKIVSKRV
jgi:hypothetical protein